MMITVDDRFLKTLNLKLMNSSTLCPLPHIGDNGRGIVPINKF